MAQAIMANKAGEKWELIETFTLTESGTIAKTQEPDGTPYNFSKIMVTATGFVGKFAWNIGCRNYDTDQYWTTIGGNNRTSSSWGMIQAEMVNGLCIGRSYDDTSMISSSWDYASSLHMLAQGVTSDSIVSIRMTNAVTGTFSIYAVRA